MMYDTLTKIRELVDELYDNTQPHSPTNSMLFLEINQAIDDAQRYARKCESGSLYGKMAQTESGHYIGTELDPFNEEQVNDIVNKNRRIY